jgi:plastocyanin
MLGPLLTRRTALATAAGAWLGWPARSRAAAAAVSIDNFAFTPAMLTVPAGTRVTWANGDDIPHTVVSALHPPLFKSPPLDSGEAFAFVFDAPGTYGYFCSLHPHMQGTIVVT